MLSIDDSYTAMIHLNVLWIITPRYDIVEHPVPHIAQRNSLYVPEIFHDVKRWTIKVHVPEFAHHYDARAADLNSQSGKGT